MLAVDVSNWLRPGAATSPGRLRSDRVMQLPAPPRQPHTRGRPRKHGGELALADPATWPDA
jgi:hypothetical protein